MCQRTALETLRYIEHTVNTFLRPGLGIDRENLAGDIWLALWIGNKQPSREIIRLRCIDSVRAAGKLRELSPDYDTPIEEPVQPRDLKQEVDFILQCPWISDYERSLLFHRYYAGRTDQFIASLFFCSREKITKDLAQIINKLRVWTFLHGNNAHK